MKYIIAIILSFAIATSALAQTQDSKYFDTIKIYLDRDYILNDTLEFTVFDMSEIKVINESKRGFQQAKSSLEGLPKKFYSNLKKQINKQRVPITLYSSYSPDYAKPLQLSIKIKRIHIKPTKASSADKPQYQIAMRVYGQLKDKNSNEILFKFYDSQTSIYNSGKRQADNALNTISNKMMKNLALYMRTKYWLLPSPLGGEGQGEGDTLARPASKLNIVFLDAATVDYGDVDLTPIKKLGRFTHYNNTKPSHVISRAKTADVIITNKVKIDKSNIKSLKKLKLICVAATGFNIIDVELANTKNVPVTNSVGYSTRSVVEHSLMFLLALSHRLVENNRAVIEKKWSRSPNFNLTDFPYSNLEGKTLGLIGYGTIGKEVAKLAKILGMTVLIAKIPGRKYKHSPKREPLNTVLKKSDFVNLHCPLTNLTENLIQEKNIKLMKKTAYLINLARGPIVKESAIVKALQKNQLAGYATDVMNQEPPPKNHPFFQKSLKDKIFFTPHIAWASRESRQNMINDIALTIKAFKSGNLRNIVV